ncbi:MAG: TIGR00366 family protein [Cloacibacillus sp.]
MSEHISSNPESMVETSKGIKIPHVWTIIFFCLIAAGLMTYLIPAGLYDRIEVAGRKVVDPNTFHFITQSPVSVFGWFVCIIEGMQQSMPIMCMVLCPIAATDIYIQSGTMEKMISWILRTCRSDKVIMLGLMIFFACRGAMGAMEHHIPFVPLAISISLICGYDVMVGLLLVFMPTFVSFAVGPLNIYTVAVAQGISGLPLYSAMAFRVVIWLVCCAITFWYIFRYAKRVKADHSLSVTGFVNPSSAAGDKELEKMRDERMSVRQKVLMVMFLITTVLQMVGPIKFEWGFSEIAALWLVSGILAGVVAGYNNEKICSIFVRSWTSDILIGTFCIGFARAVSLVLTKGNVLDTIIYALAVPLKQIPISFSAIGMYFTQSIINFFIPSGSGQATVTMPIMAPLADIIGMTRQTAVIAFQMGDGLTNMIIPTFGTLIIYISIAKVDFKTYIKWVYPLYFMLVGVACVTLLIATAIKLGPF